MLGRRWLAIAAIWLGVGLFEATQTVAVMHSEGMHHNWVRLFVTLLLSWVPWALATPLVVYLGRQYPPLQLRPWSTWFRHFAACAGIGLASAAWDAVFVVTLNPWASGGAPESVAHVWILKFSNGLLSYLILYTYVLAVSYVLDSRDRLAAHQTERARLNEQLSKAQLDALRRQIEPHFLFNTLNAISGLVRENRNDAAVSMIAGLSDFLRRAIEDSNRQTVPLGEEMEFLQKYLDIQKIRFAERLQVSVEFPPDLSSAQVPSLVLQPMVENAIKHGIAKRPQGGVIRISAIRNNGTLTLSVYNDGPGFPDDVEQSATGVGVANIRSRLKSIYGSSSEFTMRNQGPGGVEVAVSVPYTEKSSIEK